MAKAAPVPAGGLEPRAPAGGRSRLLAVAGLAAATVVVAVVLVIALTGDDGPDKISTGPSTTASAAETADALAALAQGTGAAPTAPQPTAPPAAVSPPVAAPKPSTPAPQPAAPAAKSLNCGPIFGGGVSHQVRSSSAAQPEPCQSARSVVLQALNSGSSQVGTWRCVRQPSAAILIRCVDGAKTLIAAG